MQTSRKSAQVRFGLCDNSRTVILTARLVRTEAARLVELQAEIDNLRETLGDKDAGKIVDKHIKLLHEYNEAKDATQIIIGKLAVHKETTVKQLHEGYGLAADD
ncbi:Swi5-domain-containing protein [Phellopilus nigrolimitatus]|nr:Swi5-domain-containing protein [Phellopilus nigrolimitatus]